MVSGRRGRQALGVLATAGGNAKVAEAVRRDGILQELSMIRLRLAIASLAAAFLMPLSRRRGSARSCRQERRGRDGKRLPAAPVRRSQDRRAIGWEYDAMNEIAKRLNFKVEYQNTSWDAMIQSVSDGQYNIGMTGITIKDDRKEKVDFSDPYMRSEQFMLVRGDETRFPTPSPSPSSRTGLSARSRVRRPSTRPSTACSTATSRTRASSCSRPSGHRAGVEGWRCRRGC